MHRHRRTSDKVPHAAVGDKPRVSGERRLIACSLWLYLGFIGASVLATGLMQLFDGRANATWAWLMAVAGAVMAAACWRRGRAVVGRDERAQPAAVDLSFVVGPEVTRLGRHAGNCAELAAWPDAVRRTRSVTRH